MGDPDTNLISSCTPILIALLTRSTYFWADIVHLDPETNLGKRLVSVKIRLTIMIGLMFFVAEAYQTQKKFRASVLRSLNLTKGLPGGYPEVTRKVPGLYPSFL